MKEKTKVYIYTRVSTAVQVDGYSLDAQKSRMKAYAEFNDFEIVGEYEDAGKSGKSIEGRLEFNRMMEDIKSGKDGVSYVLVFKLSRFGRNAADVLSTLQVMQDFDVNLICVEDGIDSSKDAGKLMISVLSAVAEIERENIRVQTMEGRIQKAREGKWNGGFAPYGYKLEKGMLYINEEEAEAIRIIFDQYVHTDIGANGLAKYLANHGINKIQRQNGKNPLFDAALIRRILKNPVYCGKIAYGRRRTEKVHGTRNDYRLVEQENYLLVDGLHEAIVSEGLWHEAQVKLLAQAKKYEKVNNGKDNKVHLLTGLLKCPICGAGMYGNKSIKHKPDGTKYKDFFYYGCKHRTMTRGHKCEYKKQINEELLDGAVAEVIIKLVSNPKFAAMMQQKINMKIDTSAIEQEIANYEKQLRQSYATKSRLIDEIDTLDPDDKHYIKRKADLDDRLYKMYDKIEDTENLLIEARAKKMAIEAEKLTADNIYKVLIYFEKLYAVMDEQEKRQIMESLISEIHIYEERQPNGQWLKSIKFKLPIIEEDMEMSLDSDTHVDKQAITGNTTLYAKWHEYQNTSLTAKVSKSNYLVNTPADVNVTVTPGDDIKDLKQNVNNIKISLTYDDDVTSVMLNGKVLDKKEYTISELMPLMGQNRKLDVTYGKAGTHTFGIVLKNGDKIVSECSTDIVVVEKAAELTPATKLYTLTVKNADVTIKNGDEEIKAEKNDKGELIAKVPEKADVTVTYTSQSDAVAFDQWTITTDETLDVDVKNNPLKFQMPAGGVTIEAMTKDASIEEDEPNILGTAAVVGTAAAGTAILAWQGYQLGTELYLKTALPAGTAIPTNRAELALLVWNHAGKPAPAAVLPADATDTQKAIAWAVENDLLKAAKDNGETYVDTDSVSRVEVIRVWNKAQEK